MRTIAIALLLTLSISAASAQEAPKFAGDCKPFKDAAACQATQWCHWVQPKKAVALPNGQQFTRTASCGFKSGFKAGWKATAAKQ